MSSAVSRQLDDWVERFNRLFFALTQGPGWRSCRSGGVAKRFGCGPPRSTG